MVINNCVKYIRNVYKCELKALRYTIGIHTEMYTQRKYFTLVSRNEKTTTNWFPFIKIQLLNKQSYHRYQTLTECQEHSL